MHIQINSNCWTFLSLQAISVLFNCVESLILDLKVDLDIFQRSDSIILSVTKSIIELCPLIIKVLGGLFGMNHVISLL